VPCGSRSRGSAGPRPEIRLYYRVRKRLPEFDLPPLGKRTTVGHWYKKLVSSSGLFSVAGLALEASGQQTRGVGGPRAAARRGDSRSLVIAREASEFERKWDIRSPSSLRLKPVHGVSTDKNLPESRIGSRNPSSLAGGHTRPPSRGNCW
jgi:hypothetical protein